MSLLLCARLALASMSICGCVRSTLYIFGRSSHHDIANLCFDLSYLTSLHVDAKFIMESHAYLPLTRTQDEHVPRYQLPTLPRALYVAPLTTPSSLDLSQRVTGAAEDEPSTNFGIQNESTCEKMILIEQPRQQAENHVARWWLCCS